MVSDAYVRKVCLGYRRGCWYEVVVRRGAMQDVKGPYPFWWMAAIVRWVHDNEH